MRQRSPMHHSPTAFTLIPATLILAAGLMATSELAAARQAHKKALAQPSPDTTRTATNDFPTQARVEYVMQCMAEHGGANLDNMYHCVCAIDKIASLMNFQEYSESLTFTYMFDTPGEKGGEFRDPPKSKVLRDKLKNASHEAEFCFPTIATKPTEPAAKP